MKIGFIGLGQMGSGMAANLLKAGHDVTLFNRTRAKAEALAAQGAHIADSIAQACSGDAVVTMLANDEAAESIVYGEDGILARMKRGALHVSCSTIGVAFSERMTESHAAAGQLYVAAPVFGRPHMAAAGQLFVAAAGEAEALQDAAPIFDAVGKQTFVMSDRPSRANLVKLSGNFLIASVIEALGEALALVGKGGVDKTVYLDLLTSTLFNAPVYKTYGKLIVEGKFEPAGFAAPLGLKDIKLGLAAADDLKVALPLASLLRDRFITLIAQGGEHLDWSAIGQLAARDAGTTAP